MVELIQQPVLSKRFPSRLSGSTLERLSDYFKADTQQPSITPPRRRLRSPRDSRTVKKPWNASQPRSSAKPDLHCPVLLPPPELRRGLRTAPAKLTLQKSLAFDTSNSAPCTLRQPNPASQAWNLLEQATYGIGSSTCPDLQHSTGDDRPNTADQDASTTILDGEPPVPIIRWEGGHSPQPCYSPQSASAPVSPSSRPKSPREEKLLHHQAKALWHSLPQVARFPTDRSQLTELNVALEEALHAVQSPKTITMPPKMVVHHDRDNAKAHEEVLQQIRKWNAQEQLSPEVEVWEKVLLELCRQVHVQCADRGALLYRATVRYKDMMQDVFGACAGLKSNMVEMAERLGAVAAQVADERRARLMLQKRLTYQQMVTDQLQQRLKQKEIELEEVSSKLRRGRFDILEDELKKYKASLDSQTGEFMVNLREMMEAEYQQKLNKALYGV